MKTAQMPARNGSIDYLRGVGAFAIVWFHLKLPGAEVALGALNMFVGLLVYNGLDRALGERFQRLMWPWIVWSSIYAMAKVADATTAGRPLASEFEWWMLATGAGLHLWFLPFCILAIAVLVRLQVTGLGLVLIACASFWASNFVALPIPFAQWVAVAASAVTGALLARHPGAWIWAFATAIIALALFGVGWRLSTLPFAVGTLTTIVALACPVRPSALSRILGTHALGLYLAHPLVYAVVLRIDGLNRWMELGLVFFGGLASAALVRRVFPGAA